MTDTLTGSELAATIEKVVTMLPDAHDQGSWFYSYEQGYDGTVDPDSIHLVELLDAVEAGEEVAKEVKCNTTLCTAGWALILNGYTLSKDECNEDVAIKEDEKFDIGRAAQKLLDIDKRTADALFDGDTSNEDAVTILSYLGRGDHNGAADYITDMQEEETGRCGCGCDDDYDNDYDY